MKISVKRAAKLAHFLTFVFFLIVCFCGWRIAKKFGVVTLDQIFFHLMAPWDGMDKGLVLWGIRYLGITLAILICYYVVFFHEPICIKLSQTKYIKAFYRPFSSLWHTEMAVFFIIFSLCYAEVKYNALSYFFEKESHFIENNYVKVQSNDVIMADSVNNSLSLSLFTNKKCRFSFS